MKRIIGLFSIGLVFLTSGCFKKDDLEDITIYTSVYPIEYIVDTLYGKNSNVKSIYPDGVDVSKYSLTDKQIKDYSKGNMFIFNGLSDEKDYVTSMFNYNKDLMIIDTTATMEYNNHVEELWLDPSNFLMMSLNVKNGLLEYITNQYLKTEIDIIDVKTEEESEEDRLFEKINEAIWAGDVETIKKCFPQIDKNDKQIQAELTWIVAKDVMKNRELRELYFQKYGVKYKVRKEKRRNS